MKKRIIQGLLTGAAAGTVALVTALGGAPIGWGRSITATTTSTCYQVAFTGLSITQAVQKISIYNNGPTMVRVLFNASAADLNVAVTSPLTGPIYVGSSQSFTFEPSGSGGDARLNRVTNLVLSASSGTSLVYVAGY